MGRKNVSERVNSKWRTSPICNVAETGITVTSKEPKRLAGLKVTKSMQMVGTRSLRVFQFLVRALVWIGLAREKRQAPCDRLAKITSLPLLDSSKAKKLQKSRRRGLDSSKSHTYIIVSSLRMRIVWESSSLVDII